MDIIFKWHMKAWDVICNRPAIDSRKERNSFQHATDTNHKKIGCPVAHIHVPLTLCYKGAGCVGLTGHSFLLHQDPSKHLLYIHGTCRYSMGQRVYQVTMLFEDQQNIINIILQWVRNGHIVPTLRMSKSPYMVLDTVILFITFVINSRNWLLQPTATNDTCKNGQLQCTGSN